MNLQKNLLNDLKAFLSELQNIDSKADLHYSKDMSNQKNMA